MTVYTNTSRSTANGFPHSSTSPCETPSLDRALLLPGTAEALDRTMLLMRDDVRAEVANALLLEALLAPRVVLVADAPKLASAAAQSAFIATALLFLRSGASVTLDAPDLALHGPQPPLVGTRLVSALCDAGGALMQDVTCSGDLSRAGAADIVVLFGDSRWCGSALLVLVVSANAVTSTMRAFASVRDAFGERWPTVAHGPFGGLAAAALAAAEGYKYVMRSLRDVARLPMHVNTLFAVSRDAQFTFDAGVGVSDTALTERLGSGVELGAVDVLSAGAITQAALFALARIPSKADAPGAIGTLRILEPERSDASNLNRYSLLLASALGALKVDTLAAMDLGGITVVPYPTRYTWESLVMLRGHAPAVLVGVDHIPTRWTAQRAHPEWLGVGATSHHSAMSSEHSRGGPCTWCLHPDNFVGGRKHPHRGVRLPLGRASPFLAARHGGPACAAGVHHAAPE